MKKLFAVISIAILIGILAGCSENEALFDDGNIDFKFDSNTIELTNNTGFDLKIDSLIVSQRSDEEGYIDGDGIEIAENTQFNSNETKEIMIPLNNNEDIETHDLEIDLKGKVYKGNETVPFSIAGSLRALVSRQ